MKKEKIKYLEKQGAGKLDRSPTRTPWEVYQTLLPVEGSGHGKRVAKRKDILRKKLEGTRKKWSS